MARPVFPDASFFLIEPQVEMEPYLRAFCGECPGSEFFLVGAGAACGTFVFTVWPTAGKEGSTFGIPEAKDLVFHGRHWSAEQRLLPVVTIDSLLQDKKMPRPQLVKLDVEGFELEAMRGASLLFGTTEVFVVEVSLFPLEKNQPPFEEVVSFMRQRGYVVYDFGEFGHRPYDGALTVTNVFFVQSDGFLRSHKHWA